MYNAFSTIQAAQALPPAGTHWRQLLVSSGRTDSIQREGVCWLLTSATASVTAS